MKKRKFYWIGLAVFISALFFGCGHSTGEKLYQEALQEWNGGNLVLARALMEKSIRRNAGSADNANAYNRLGELLWEMGYSQEESDAFNESLRLDDTQYDVLCNQGVARCALNDFSGAEQAFRAAAAIQPDDPRRSSFTGILYTKNRNWNEAVRLLSAALVREPNDPHMQTALALAELHTVGADMALKRLNSVMRLAPDYAPALFNIATIYRYWQQNPAEARRYFEIYMSKASPEDRFVAQARAELKAIQQGTTVQKTSPVPARSPEQLLADEYFQKGLNFHKQKDLDNAVRWYLKAVETDSTCEQAYYNLGLAYYAVNRLEVARDAFAQAVKLNPAFTEARFNLALAEYRLGHTDRARSELNLVLRQKPAYQPALDLQSRLGPPK